MWSAVVFSSVLMMKNELYSKYIKNKPGRFYFNYRYHLHIVPFPLFVPHTLMAFWHGISQYIVELATIYLQHIKM
jgi:hypothetical protein